MKSKLIRLAILILLFTVPVTGQIGPFLHQREGEREGRTTLTDDGGLLTVRQELLGVVTTATLTRDASGRITAYEAVAREEASGREARRISLRYEETERAYLVTISRAIGSRRLTVSGSPASLLLDPEVPGVLLAGLVPLRGGFVGLLDLSGRPGLGTVEVQAVDASHRVLRLPSGPVALRLTPDGAPRELVLSDRPSIRMVLEGAVKAAVEEGPPAGVHEERITVEVAGEESPRAGVFCRPAEGGPFPAVVIVPGAGARDADGTGPGVASGLSRDLARDLARVGVASLRFDKRDETARLAELEDDLKRAIDRLAKVEGVNAEMISLVGFGEGALIAARVFARETADERLRAAILLAPPARPLPEALEASLRADLAAGGAGVELIEREVQQLRQSLAELLSVEDAETLPAESRLVKDLLLVHPLQELLKIKRPFFVVYGAEDRRVPVGHRSLLRTALALQGASRYRFQTLSQSDHEFFELDARGVRTGRHPALVPFMARFLREVGGLDKPR